ncbi:hypothetical protein GCM10022402_19500 [Salinactinospora qingdaonensis]|uniref:Secreted protein n=1 Tax=Salinactinospora qingdaonensis TaxID=702744 RepID=A0ABP7FH99_9ACTN
MIIGALLCVAVAAVAIAGTLVLLSQRRRRHLRARFGPEYEREVHRRGSRLTAERALAHRQRRHARFHLRSLPAYERDEYTEEWSRIRERFVDTPLAAVHAADDLVTKVMAACGYPVGDHDQQIADLSVDHVDTVEEYRRAREIVARAEGGGATTEDLRTAMVHYRALVSALVGRDLPRKRPAPSDVGELQ